MDMNDMILLQSQKRIVNVWRNEWFERKCERQLHVHEYRSKQLYTYAEAQNS